MNQIDQIDQIDEICQMWRPDPIILRDMSNVETRPHYSRPHYSTRPCERDEPNRPDRRNEPDKPD